ncbi:MAG TPA: hypothetical protein VIZ70_04735 [Propionibacteriaceae bacterium]
MPNHRTTPLASDTINASGDTIEVVLVQPADNPSMIMIRWPAKATPVPPSAYADTAARTMRVLATANVALTQRRADGR